MKFIYSDKYCVNIGIHPWKTEKYKIIYNLLKEKGFNEFIEPEPAREKDLLLVHTKQYLSELKKLRKGDYIAELPFSKELLTAAYMWCNGTFLASLSALKNKLGLHIGGGWHHAFPDHGEGFCILNDIAFAIRKLQNMGEIESALIIDLDLHQGNGNAYIFRKDKRVFTFSMHQENIYPIKIWKSDLDIGLLPNTSDREYLSLLQRALLKIKKNFSPDIVIYQAGVDPYKEDLLSSLNISEEGLRLRDRTVFNFTKEINAPISITLGGGYTPNINKVSQLHLNTLLEGIKVMKGRKIK